MADKKATLILQIKELGADAIDKIGSSLSALKDIALVGFAAISAVVVKSVAEFRESEEATNALSQAMVNNGIYSKQLKDDYANQAKELQKLTTYSDDQVTAAQAVLQGYLGETKITKELTMATADLAARKKIDLASAAEMVGKSIGTSTNALARQGIEVGQNITKAERYTQVIQGLNQQFGGQAIAAAQGLGSLAQLKNSLNDVFEEIGQRLSPVITVLVLNLKQVLDNATVTGGAIQSFVGLLQVLTNVGIVLYGVLEAVGKTIGTELASAITTVTNVLNGDFKKAWDTQALRFQEHGDNMVDVWKNTTDRLAQVNQAFAASTEADRMADEQNEIDSLARRAQVRSDARAQQAIDELTQQIEFDDMKLQAATISEQNRNSQLLALRAQMLQNLLAKETDTNKKSEILRDLHNTKIAQLDAVLNEQQIKNRADTLNTIATLQNANSKELAAIGKAAAITQIAIETPVAIAKALSAFPPPANFIAAGVVGVAMAAQAARIAGVQLADGGIVRATPGGVPAIIGEGGQDEAVIPLDRAGEFGFGGGGQTVININSYGGMLGTPSEAREFAIAVDRQLLELRRNRESVSFDDGVT